MKSKLEIIEETKNYYNTNNRAVKDGKCVYLSNDGKTCAVGRCMIEPTIKMVGNVGGILNNAEKVLNLDGLLKPEYRGHEINFWKELQNFHDCELHWDENGLSKGGEVYYKQLIDNWK